MGLDWIEVRDKHDRLLCKVTPDLSRVQVKVNGKLCEADLPSSDLYVDLWQHATPFDLTMEEAYGLG